jgi:cell division protein FtsI (penicillin-binding protein 3)
VNIKKSILLRVRIAFLLVMLFGTAVVAKIAHIQFVEGEQWIAMGEKMGLKYKAVKATRGNIYSDNGSLLATSLPFYRVAFDATIASDVVFKKGVDSLSIRLSQFFGDQSTIEYKRRLIDARAGKRQFMFLSHDEINYREMKRMSRWPIFREGRLGGGVIFNKVDKRFLPFSHLSRRTIGYINENNRGAGLEYSFNDILAGQDGELLYQKIAGGSWKPVFDSKEIKAERGYDIETTIDVNLQDVTETALLRALEEHNADYGTAVVMEVNTGEIKAISNLERNNAGYYYERYNYAVGGLHEPGSTFKLATMIALLEETNISLQDSIDTGSGEYKVFDNVVRDHKAGGFGNITVQESFEKSSNVAMAKLVEKHFGHRPEKFLEYVDRLHISQTLNFQIKGEGKPKIKRPGENSWSGITLPWMAYGYGLEVTPLQTLTLYNAIANNGKMIQPIIVRSVRDAHNVKQRFKGKVINSQICSDVTLNKLRRMLEGVVSRGTAQNIKGTHYKIAGKTGTAQLLEDGRYTRKYITSFAGYFPADNPRYSAIILIRNPKGWRQYGSNVAAPVFKEIADNIYARDVAMHQPMPLEFIPSRGIFPVIRAGYMQDLRYLCNELGVSNHSMKAEEWVNTEVQGNAVYWKDAYIPEDAVPDVEGMTLKDALYLLEKKGYRVSYHGKGRVQEQSEYPGKKMPEGSLITIKLG